MKNELDLGTNLEQVTKWLPADEMLKYIHAIRNSDKRDYAFRYFTWLMRPTEERQIIVEPVPHNLTFMGAQSVRMRLHAIAKQ